jgi:hypothetical protein
MSLESVKLLDDLVESGAITKEAAERISAERDALLEAVSCDILEGDGQEKTATLMEMLEAIKGRVAPSPTMRAQDPAVYHAIQEAYKAGQKETMKRVPASVMSLGNPWRTATALMAMAIGARGVGAIGESYGQRLRQRRLHAEIEQSRDMMFDKFPELKENRELATEAFEVLSRYSPSLAASPRVAGSFVKSTLAATGGETVLADPVMIKTLTDVELAMERAHDIGAPSGELTKGVSRDVSSVLGKMMSGDLF